MTEQKFQQGDQVAYLPPHVDGDMHHADVEYGFVTSKASANMHEFYYCRFWRKGAERGLRTLANSELAPADCLVKHDSVDQVVVDRALVTLGYRGQE